MLMRIRTMEAELEETEQHSSQYASLYASQLAKGAKDAEFDQAEIQELENEVQRYKMKFDTEVRRRVEAERYLSRLRD